MKRNIDLSVLTPDEIAQFGGENAVVLEEGDFDVALYLRFSSERQKEQSIEGQLRDAITYCRQRHYRVAAVYADRALSASKETEKRLQFLRMIAESEKRRWQYVVVWKLDRFARKKYDSVVYKMRLSKNGVKVLSVTEEISDNPEGIILESVLEGMAEFYSAELSQKITRGMRESALKCNSVGGHVPLGYKIENHKLVVEPVGAGIVKKAFEMYAEGWSVADICREFNRRGYRTAKNAEFNRNSFKIMLRNKRYIGVYTYKDVEIENGVPAIIDRELFDRVGERLRQTGDAPARGKAKTDYLLSGKIFCGHCGAPMVGECGKSHTGVVHYYYACAARKKNGSCRKKSMRKEQVEEWVAQDALSMLTPVLIDEIADIAVKQTEQEIKDQTRIPALTARQREIEKSILNIVSAIEQGAVSDTLTRRLSELEAEEKMIKKELTEEQHKVVRIDKDQIVFWLERFARGDIKDDAFKRQLFDLLINSVTVWDLPDGDFRITTAYNLTSSPAQTFKASEKFGLRGETTTIERISELVVIGYIALLTKNHSRA